MSKYALTFDRLRAANLARLSSFKNSRGNLAHSEPDGSDWSPAQWLQAIVGELGEYANKRKKYERGDIDRKEFQVEAAKELADVQIYLDILAYQLNIDLGDAVVEKFDEVSDRVGADVYLCYETFYISPDSIGRYHLAYPEADYLAITDDLIKHRLWQPIKALNRAHALAKAKKLFG